MSAEPTRDDAAPATSAYTIRSVERVVDVLELLATAQEPISLDHVAEAADLPRSSAFRYLSTLESRGYAVREATGSGYVLGPSFPRLTDRGLEELTVSAQPHMEQLAADTGETVNLGILSGTRVTYLAIVESHRQVRLAAKVGDRDLVHTTALGKAIASRLPEPAIRHILRVEGMPARTERTITDPDAYLTLLEQIRAEGYAVDDRENEADGRCVAVPIPTAAHQAAISFSAPASRFPPDQIPAVAAQLRDAAAEIADDLMRRTGAV